jgi:hypothetical protein
MVFVIAIIEHESEVNKKDPGASQMDCGADFRYRPPGNAAVTGTDTSPLEVLCASGDVIGTSKVFARFFIASSGIRSNCFKKAFLISSGSVNNIKHLLI